ncbi:MAG: hypothetical protein ACRCXZ_10345 [Patescibacteria group bacterium]
MDIPIFVSSDRGNSIDQYFNPPIVLDPRKKYTMQIVNATMFFTFPNVYNTTTTDHQKNNVLTFSVGATNYTITIPEGLYDIQSLNTTLSQELINQNLASDLIVILGDAPTQRSIIQLNNANLSINWTTSSLKTILGFNVGTSGPGASGLFYYSQNTANFNTLSEILLHCSACSGFRNNTGQVSYDSDVVSSILIDAGVSQQIIYDPNQSIKVPIIQNILDRVTFFFTDQENRTLTNNEPWTVTAIISEWK